MGSACAATTFEDEEGSTVAGRCPSGAVDNYLEERWQQCWLEAANGREGLVRLHENPEIGLVLVDWNMPEMNGLDFIKAVRAQPAYRSLRIMMVTTETEQEQLRRALEAGADEYVMKPFTKEILVAKLSLLDVLEE